MFCNVCPSYSKNRQNVLKTNNLVGVSLTQPFLPMQPRSDSLARSWTRLLPSRELCSPCWQSPTWAHRFLLFLPSLPWVGGLLTVSFLFQQGLGTFAQAVPSPWNTLSSPSVTHSHSSFHLQGWRSLHHHPWPNKQSHTLPQHRELLSIFCRNCGYVIILISVCLYHHRTSP